MSENDKYPRLLPCPFCGGDPYLERSGTHRQSCIVVCRDCGSRHTSPDAFERSGESWNMRSAPVSAERARASWLPMDTAPKTGHPIEDILILAQDRHGNKNVYLCHWAHGGGEDQPHFGPAWFYKVGESGFVELTGKALGWLPSPASRDGDIAPPSSASTSEPKCATCHGTGQVPVGYSGQESDGNAMEFERCGECGYGDAPVSHGLTLDECDRFTLRAGPAQAASEGGDAAGVGARPAEDQAGARRMTADPKLLADLDNLIAYITDETGKMPMPEVSDIPGTMRRAADALRRYVGVRPLVPGVTPEKQAAWDAFYETVKSEIPHNADGSHSGTFWVALMAGIAAYISNGD